MQDLMKQRVRGLSFALSKDAHVYRCLIPLALHHKMLEKFSSSKNARKTNICTCCGAMKGVMAWTSGLRDKR